MTLPLLWICGAPGIGKSVVGWALRNRLVRDGVPVAYVDIDQLGMCFPEPEDDPTRERLQARVLADVVEGFEAAGASAVVVTGCADTEQGPPAAALPADVTIVRLHAEADVVEARLVARGNPEMVEGARREVAALASTTYADAVVDTAGRDVEAVSDAVRAALPAWPGQPTGPTSATTRAETVPTPPADGVVLLLTGPTGVGKSTIGFPVFVHQTSQGRTGYLDLDQLGMFDAPDPHALRARNAAAAWARFAEAGARRLVVTGQVDEATLPVYEAAFAPSRVVAVRLHADAAEHRERVLSRRAGGSWAQPGDPLRGLPVEEVERVAELAIADGSAAGTLVDTTGRDPWDLAAQIVSLLPDAPVPAP